MNLLSALCSGFPACANGTAQVYIRGTNTRATWYASFEGDSPNSTGQDIPLDAYGSALVYVNQLVDVRLYDADSVLYREYGDGYASPNIEVVSPSFTGTDYVSALSAVNEPTTLQAVLDLWDTNAGAPDWKVLIDGSSTTLRTAFGSLSGLVFNVKNPAYGAVGDGVTNDQAAIAAALADAVAAGGGTVFFPKGTYLISTAIEWSHLVNIVGIGARLSRLTTNSASNARIITWTTGTAQVAPLTVSGMSFDAAQANSGEQVYANVAVNLRIVGCDFGVSSNATGNLLRLTAGGTVEVTDTRFASSGSGYCSYMGGTGFMSFHACSFIAGTAVDQALLRLDSGYYSITGCVFNIAGVTSIPSGLYGIETVGAAGKASVLGCAFIATGIYDYSSCIRMINTMTVNATGNYFGSPIRYEMAAGRLPLGSSLELKQVTRDNTNSTTPTIPNGLALLEYDSTGGKPTWTMPTGFFIGQVLEVITYNHSGGTWALGSTFTGAEVSSGLSVDAVPTTNSAYYRFVYSDLVTAGTDVWRMVAVG